MATTLCKCGAYDSEYGDCLCDVMFPEPKVVTVYTVRSYDNPTDAACVAYSTSSFDAAVAFVADAMVHDVEIRIRVERNVVTTEN